MNKNRPKFAVFGFFAFLIGMQIFLGCNRTPGTQPQTKMTNTNTLTETNPPPEAKVVEATNAPIEGFFGLKLGELLPSGCSILSSEINPNDGFLRLEIVPPQPNAAFNQYFVRLNPSTRVTSQIEAFGEKPVDSWTSQELRKTLHQRYGDNYGILERWDQGHRHLDFSDSYILTISCWDDQLYKHLGPANTNGL